MALQPGETLDLNTRVGGGVEIHRDVNVPGTFAIDGHGGELSRSEIRRLAEAAGFEVTLQHEGGEE